MNMETRGCLGLCVLLVSALVQLIGVEAGRYIVDLSVFHLLGLKFLGGPLNRRCGF